MVRRTETPHVTTFIIMTTEDFRSDVIGRAHARGHEISRRGRVHSWQAKVNDLKFRVVSWRLK